MVKLNEFRMFQKYISVAFFQTKRGKLGRTNTWNFINVGQNCTVIVLKIFIYSFYSC